MTFPSLARVTTVVVVGAFLAGCTDVASSRFLAPSASAAAKAPAPGGGGGGGGVKPAPVAQVCPGLPGDTTVTFDESFAFPNGGVPPVGAVDYVGATPYTLVFNFTDPAQPLSQAVNLLCRPINPAVIQFTFQTQVTGTIGVETPAFAPGTNPVNVIHVHIIQISTFKDVIGG